MNNDNIVAILKLWCCHTHEENLAGMCNISLPLIDCGSLGFEKPET